MNLSEDQIEKIHLRVSSELSIKTLKDDVMDHLCCSVEEKFSEGKSFDDALKESIHELTPDGIYIIEQETIMLLNSNNIYMKKFLYFTGLVTTINMTMGLMFKILHMPGGDVLFNYSFFIFTLVFMPITVYNSLKMQRERSMAEKLRIAFGFLSAIIVGLSVLFKMMQYTGADILLMTGVSVFCFGFLPSLFYTLYTKSVTLTRQ
jgi:hypothetical protein